MPVEGKNRYTIYLTPEYVDYLRDQWGDANFMENGLSGVLDAFLKQQVKAMRFMERITKGRKKISKKTVEEILKVKPVT